MLILKSANQCLVMFLCLDPLPQVMGDYAWNVQHFFLLKRTKTSDRNEWAMLCFLPFSPFLVFELYLKNINVIFKLYSVHYTPFPFIYSKHFQIRAVFDATCSICFIMSTLCSAHTQLGRIIYPGHSQLQIVRHPNLPRDYQ